MTAPRWLPGARAIASYQASWARRDVVAGIVLTTLLVPQGMAYAELAGLPAITGLYTSILCLVGYAAVGVGVARIGNSSYVLASGMFQNEVCVGLANTVLVHAIAAGPLVLALALVQPLSSEFFAFCRDRQICENQAARVMKNSNRFVHF